MAPPMTSSVLMMSGNAMVTRAKGRRENTSVTPETPLLPADLMLDIVALSDPVTLVRCAATCKLLRRDILDTSFIRRVSHGVVAPCILAYLCSNVDKLFALVHPATPAAASLCHDQLFPFFTRRAAVLFDQYSVETSRHGLVLLRRINIGNQPYSIVNRPKSSERCSNDLCVYDPTSGAQTFLSCPPQDGRSNSICSGRKYVLLTAADGINYPFQLLVADMDRCSIKLQTTSSRGTWRPRMHVINRGFLPGLVERRRNPVILHGRIINWLVYHDKKILSYDLGKRKRGSIELPHTNCDVNQLHLTTSSDGNLLKLLSIDGFMMSVWLQRPCGGWSLEILIDMEERLQLLHPNISTIRTDNSLIVFEGSESRSCNVVFLRVPGPGYYRAVTVLDLETKDMHIQERSYSLLEINLPSRLQKLKLFS